jgi:hypothetical protein
MAGVLLLFLFGIARFYQHMAGERSRYRLFLIPLVLFIAAGLRYTWIGGLSGDWLGDLLFCLGGISLFTLGISLDRLMMGRRQP